MLTAKVHSYLDYITIFFFLMAPSLVPLSETGTLLAYALAIVHFLMTIFTASSLSLIRLIPFQLHGYVELVVSIFLITAPWLLADFFSDTDQFFYTICGILIFVVWFLTSYRNPLADHNP